MRASPLLRIERGTFFGTYAGYIRDTDDKEMSIGRVRVYCPEVMGEIDDESHWLNWAMPSFPWVVNAGAGTKGGAAYVPAVDSNWGVWIQFRQGNIQFPIWTGVFPLADNKQLDFKTIKLEANGVTLVIDGTNGVVSINGTTYSLLKTEDFLTGTNALSDIITAIKTALNTNCANGVPLILTGSPADLKLTAFLTALAGGTYKSTKAKNG